MSIYAEWTDVLTRRKSGRVLLHSLMFLFLMMILGNLSNIIFSLLIRMGAPFPPALLQKHFLWRSFILGVVAASPPFSFVLARWIEAADKKWVWIPYSFWMAVGLLFWVGHDRDTSVLADRPHYLTQLAGLFFVQDCTLSLPVNSVFLSPCFYQIVFSALWMGSLGYSLAAIRSYLRAHSAQAPVQI